MRPLTLTVARDLVLLTFMMGARESSKLLLLKRKTLLRSRSPNEERFAAKTSPQVLESLDLHKYLLTFRLRADMFSSLPIQFGGKSIHILVLKKHLTRKKFLWFEYVSEFSCFLCADDSEMSQVSSSTFKKAT